MAFVIPKEFGIPDGQCYTPDGQCYTVEQTADGTIIFRPIPPSLFKENGFQGNELRQKDVSLEDGVLDSEWSD
ncbi:hypothetical protein [Limosilactobacillus fermentum]|uniref:hypothetical protein n=1 Tax=Limosilactobacillus fermentum TaxID=1613 RepID=UPI00280B7F8E|nr:hypothetical protein [Limosilactobacillus fermentum]